MRIRRLNTIIAAAALTTAALAGCGDGGDTATEDVTVTDEAELTPTDEAERTLTDEAEQTPTDEAEQPGVGEEGEGGAAQEELEVGSDVDVTGEVAEVLSPEAFTLGGDEIGEDPILVIGATGSADVNQGDTVQVSGTVVTFSVVGTEEEFDIDIIDQEFEDFEGDPAIQAESVTVQ